MIASKSCRTPCGSIKREIASRCNADMWQARLKPVSMSLVYAARHGARVINVPFHRGARSLVWYAASGVEFEVPVIARLEPGREDVHGCGRSSSTQRGDAKQSRM